MSYFFEFVAPHGKNCGCDHGSRSCFEDFQREVMTEMHFLLQKTLKNIMHGRVKMYVMR